jgi:hypothetical protein
VKDVLLPAADGLFIPPPGKRQDFAVGGQALKTFDINKSVDLRQQRLQFGGQLQVARLMSRLGFGFTKDCDNGFLSVVMLGRECRREKRNASARSEMLCRMALRLSGLRAHVGPVSVAPPDGF